VVRGPAYQVFLVLPCVHPHGDSESDFKWGEERRGWGRGGDSESKVAEPG
jgi:hypothetical protein